MLFLEVFFALWWIWLPAIVIWLYVRSKNSKTDQSLAIPSSDNNQLWLEYIASFLTVAKTKAEKNIVQALLDGKSADQLYAKESSVAATTNNLTTSDNLPEQTLEPTAEQLEVPAPEPRRTNPPDNTLLLLYFGAFLLVASAGLFVAIGDVTPLLRTILVAITAALLYIGGLWLYKTKQKLTQAGLSFIGTGMVIAPLTGVAWYNLVADQSGGALIWFITSLFCLGLYVHAFITVRNDFMAYLLIGSFVSSVESMVLVADFPSYVFAWVAILIGLGFQLYLGLANRDTKFSEAQTVSSQLLVPLSVLGSLVLLHDFGSLQLGVSLLLAATYYALLAFKSMPDKIETYSPAAQISFIAGLSNLVYYATESLRSIGIFLAVVGLVYILVIILFRAKTIATHGIMAIGALTIFLAAIISLNEPVDFTVYLAEALLFAILIWLKFASKSAFQVAGLLLIALPFAIGQYALSDSLSVNAQTALNIIPVVTLFCATILSYKKELFHDFLEASSSLLLISIVTFIGTSVLGSFPIVMVASAVCICLLAGLKIISGDSRWWSVSSIITTIPFFFALFVTGYDDKNFVIATGVILVANIILSLITREELVRWILTGTILITPVALGSGGLGFKWESFGFSFGYVAAMFGLVLARAIARGKLLVSKKVSIASYDKQSSLGFSFGYISSAIIASLISLGSPDSQMLTTVVLAIVAVAFGIAFFYVEKEIQGLAVLPILAQLILISGLRPDSEEKVFFAICAIIASLVAGMIYFLITLPKGLQDKERNTLLNVALATAYTGPLYVVMTYEISALLPISLTIAGALSLYHYQKSAQRQKELCIAVITASLQWSLYLIGVTNIHIHTHILLVLLGGFAYWRAMNGDNENSKNYVIAGFVIATGPLIIQALSGDSGELYGLMLIIQQAAFMTIGVLLNQRFLTKAGLWVALASVLYQLRGLGWAFLTIVAAILIGLAIYRLQKHDPDQQ